MQLCPNIGQGQVSSDCFMTDFLLLLVHRTMSHVEKAINSKMVKNRWSSETEGSERDNSTTRYPSLLPTPSQINGCCG